MPTDAERRLHPRIFDTDWLMLRGMTRVLGQMLVDVMVAGPRDLDFGLAVASRRSASICCWRRRMPARRLLPATNG